MWNWGQEGAVKEGENGSTPTWKPPKIVLLQILLAGVTSIAFIGVSSRRLVVKKTVFGIPDLNLWPYGQIRVKTHFKISVQELIPWRIMNQRNTLWNQLTWMIELIDATSVDIQS